ncbi:MAG: AarF/UbiB family protein, partial [Gammaproteobacteria bacterium]|nr:AarF/UbiB family protein [Gammaproteobacteria bacterium]
MLNTVKRGIQIGKAGLAARRLNNASDEKQKEIARKALANLFANSRGVMMKVGQLLADSADSPYRKLLDNIEPFPLEEILPCLEESLGRPANEIFQSIDEASSAASLGQVHKAVLLSGETVAVK